MIKVVCATMSARVVGMILGTLRAQFHVEVKLDLSLQEADLLQGFTCESHITLCCVFTSSPIHLFFTEPIMCTARDEEESMHRQSGRFGWDLTRTIKLYPSVDIEYFLRRHTLLSVEIFFSM
ncbi:hypothetical protein ACJX0J_029134, partial [Zea mays]